MASITTNQAHIGVAWASMGVNGIALSNPTKTSTEAFRIHTRSLSAVNLNEALGYARLSHETTTTIITRRFQNQERLSPCSFRACGKQQA